MTVERALRLIAGTFVLLSLILAVFHSHYWLLFTAFVGLNLLQSAFSNWCPMMWVLKKSGVRPCLTRDELPLVEKQKPASP